MRIVSAEHDVDLRFLVFAQRVQEPLAREAVRLSKPVTDEDDNVRSAEFVKCTMPNLVQLALCKFFLAGSRRAKYRLFGVQEGHGLAPEQGAISLALPAHVPMQMIDGGCPRMLTLAQIARRVLRNRPL